MHTLFMISDTPDAVNGFNQELQQQLLERIQWIQRHYEPPYIAAFDADGTLWSTDVGQQLYNYQLENSLLTIDNDEAREIEAEFLEKGEHEKLYIWQAEINAGSSVEQIKDWVKRSQSGHLPELIFSPVQALVQQLSAAQFDIYIVSASFEPTLLPATEFLGIPSTHLIGASLEISNGRYLTPMKKAMTSHQGKVERLLKQTSGQHPHFCAGNTMGDFELLTSALDTRLAVSSAKKGDRNFESEQKLYEAATQRGWLTHRF